MKKRGGEAGEAVDRVCVCVLVWGVDSSRVCVGGRVTKSSGVVRGWRACFFRRIPTKKKKK